MYIRAVEVYERSRSDTFNNCYTKATKLNPLLEFSIAKNIATSKSDLDWLGFGALIFPFFFFCAIVFLFSKFSHVQNAVISPTVK